MLRNRIRGFVILLSTMVFLSGLTCQVVNAETVFRHRIMQFENPDWDYLNRMIPLASKQGITRIQLAAPIVSKITQLDDPETAAFIREAGQLAHSNTMKFDICISEFNDIPEAFINDGKVMIDDALWNFLKRRYRDAFMKVPEIDGIMLISNHAEILPYSDQVSTRFSVAGGLSQLYKTMYEICRDNAKTLFIQSFANPNVELDTFEKAIGFVAKIMFKRDRTFIVTPCTPVEFSPYHRLNRLLGYLEDLPQIMSIDLGNKNYGRNLLPYIQIDKMKELVEYAKLEESVGVLVQMDCGTQPSWGTTNELNVDAFLQLVDSPDVDVATLQTEFLKKRYQLTQSDTETLDALNEFYSNSDELIHAMFFPLNYWFIHESRLPSWKDLYLQLNNPDFAAWYEENTISISHQELCNPTNETLKKIESALFDAMNRVKNAQQRLRTAENGLSETDYQYLTQKLDLMENMIHVYEYYYTAFFTTLMYHNDPANQDIKLLARTRIQFLAKQADLMRTKFGNDVPFCNPKRIEHLSDQMFSALELSGKNKTN